MRDLTFHSHHDKMGVDNEVNVLEPWVWSFGQDVWVKQRKEDFFEY